MENQNQLSEDKPAANKPNKELIQTTDVTKLPPFERSIIASSNRLKLIERQLKLSTRAKQIFSTFDRAFKDIQKSLPGDSTKLEVHEDRVCFEIRDVPISLIYMPQAQPTFISLNKQKVLAERVFICDKYFGKNTYEMVGPSEREIGSVFVTEDTYLVRWKDKTAYFFPTIFDLAESTLHTFFTMYDMYKDKHGNDLEVNVEDWHYKVTSVDLLLNSSGDLNSGSGANVSSGNATSVQSSPSPASTNPMVEGLSASANTNPSHSNQIRTTVNKNIKLYGNKNMKF